MKEIGHFQFPENPEEAKVWTVFSCCTALAPRILAAANSRIEGTWCAYIDVVPGRDHNLEYESVLRHGCKLPESVATVLFPYFEGVPYAH